MAIIIPDAAVWQVVPILSPRTCAVPPGFSLTRCTAADAVFMKQVPAFQKTITQNITEKIGR